MKVWGGERSFVIGAFFQKGKGWGGGKIGVPRGVLGSWEDCLFQEKKNALFIPYI